MHNLLEPLCSYIINKGMDLKRLRTFVTVAELGTVTLAASRLRVSQPALSRQIHDLEEEFEIRLFDRVGRRLMLTAFGEQVLDDCRRILGEVGSLRTRLELLRGGGTGVLKVAAPPQTIESVLSQFLPRYSERFPNVRVMLTEALGHEQLTMLERGEVHLGIRHDQSCDRRFGSRALPPDEVLAACALSQQLGSASMIDIGRVVHHPLLLLDSGYSVRKMFDAACRLAEVEPKVLVESRAPHTLLALAEAGHGVAIIPSILATDRYALRIVRVAQRRKPLRERLVIQWDNRRPIPSFAEDFCDRLSKHMSEILPITQPSASKNATARRRVSIRKSRNHA
jgi:LysR family transcriptional regulator, nitrogen assimilation regulatory protein